MAALSEDDLKRYQADLERAGQFKLGEHIVTSAMVEIKPEQKKLTGRCVGGSERQDFRPCVTGFCTCTTLSCRCLWTSANHEVVIMGDALLPVCSK